LGKKGDILDYCFEHVESFACGDGLATGDLDFSNAANLSSPSYNAGKPERAMASDSNEYANDDEIQLYYHPKPRPGR
jgi:hypothetical protein